MKGWRIAVCCLLSFLLFSGCAAPKSPDEGEPKPVQSPGEDTIAPSEDSMDETSTMDQPAVFDYDTVDLAGSEVNTLELCQGYDLTLVNFWASWCGSCVSEMPGLESLYQNLQKQGRVGMLGVCLDPENAGDVQAVLEYAGVSYPVVEFRSGMERMADLKYIPVTIFIDGEGNLVGDAVMGARSQDAWQEEVENRLE